MKKLKFKLKGTNNNSDQDHLMKVFSDNPRNPSNDEPSKSASCEFKNTFKKSFEFQNLEIIIANG